MAPRKTKSQKRVTAPRRVKFNKVVRRRASSRSVQSAHSTRSNRSNRTTPSVVEVDSLNSQPTPEGYENIVLYYLAKLKKLFQTQPQAMLKANRCASRNTSLASLKRERSLSLDTPKSILKIDPSKYARKASKNSNRLSHDDVKEKALNIVAAAIDYGCANNVVAKKGNIFWLCDNKPSTSQKIAKREPTPGPKARRCSRCRIAALPRRARSMTISPSASVFEVGSGSRTTVSSARSKTRSRSRSMSPRTAMSRTRKLQRRKMGPQGVAFRRATGVKSKIRSSYKLRKSTPKTSRSTIKSNSSRSNTRSVTRMSRSRSVLNKRNMRVKRRPTKSNLQRRSSCKITRSKGILKDQCNCSLCRLSKMPQK